MTVLYFQGFDMWRWVDGIPTTFNVYDGDESLQWGYNTFTRMEFVEGYESEHAAVVDPAWRPMGLKINNAPIGEFRLGMWAKGDLVTPGGAGRYFIYVEDKDQNGFAVRAFDNGGLAIYELAAGGSAYDNELVTLATTDDLIEEEYHYYEFYGNIVTGAVSLKRDSAVIMSATGTPKPASTKVHVSIGSPEIANTIAPATWNYIFDHFWLSDGDELIEGINGVSIDAAVDMLEGGPGFRSTMMFGETRYLSDVQKAIFSSNGNDYNQTNVCTWFWINDPRDNDQWASISDIDAFGLCYGSDTAEGKQRVAGLLLGYLDYNDGKPLVKYEVPGSIGSYSGPWTKSDSSKTFSGLVNTVPRPNVADATVVDSIFCSGPGCILFYHEPPGGDDFPLQATGLTFAQEFREDYKDWVRVDGIGTSFDSYFTAGFGVFGEGNKKFQSNYITVNYENVTNGNAYIQGLWDYAFDPDTGRWSMRQNVYTGEEGYTHRARRLKIRGNGKALQIKVSNYGDRPFVINGWSMFVTSNGSV